LKRIAVMILVVMMLLPITVSADPLERVDIFVEISDIGGHYDLNFDIVPGIEIGGVMNVEKDGTCIMYLMSYEQYQPYSNQSIITEIPLPGDYTYMVERVYSEGPIEWNHTISISSNWYFVFYKAGGSLSKMAVNASIWDWNYIPVTTTYPTNTTMIITNITTITTSTPSTTITTGTDMYPTGEIPLDLFLNPYLIGLGVIGVVGLILVYWVMNSKETSW